MPLPFSVMTWNVENLFLPAATYAKGTPGFEAGAKDETVYVRKLAHLEQVIRAQSPDVVALQEIGDPRALQALHEQLLDLFPFPPVVGVADSRHIRVALLCRHELTNAATPTAYHPQGLQGVSSTSIDSNEPKTDTAMGRGIAIITFPLGIHTIHVITAHLKSKLLTYNRPGNAKFSPRNEDERAREAGRALLRRTGEAVALRAYVNTIIENTDDTLLLMGDLNDGTDAATTQLLLGELDLWPDRMGANDGKRLYNLATVWATYYALRNNLTPQEKAEAEAFQRTLYSRVYRRNRELIDHILVTNNLAKRNVRAAFACLVQGIEPVQDNPNTRKDEFIPDHAPIVARFNLPAD
jgi:predicted extracellular nuclease